MDAWRSPRGVLNDHSEDQFLNLLRRLSSPDRPPDLGDQLPVQTESGPVPTHHRFGRDHNEGLLPSGPKSTNGDPEELVESRNLQPTASNVAQLFDPWICSIALRALAALSRLSCVVHCFSDIVLTAARDQSKNGPRFCQSPGPLPCRADYRHDSGNVSN